MLRLNDIFNFDFDSNFDLLVYHKHPTTRDNKIRISKAIPYVMRKFFEQSLAFKIESLHRRGRCSL